jgi:hypothetical protein
MYRDSVRFITLVGAALSATSACRSRDANRGISYQPLSKVVAGMLATNPGWHLGTNDDCTNPRLNEKLSDNPTYQAYEAVGDVNGDGQTDRVFMVVKGDSGKLYWVPGHEDGFDTPRLLGTLDWIKEGGIIVVGQAVLFGRFDSDVAFTWKWNPSTGSFDVINNNPEPES